MVTQVTEGERPASDPQLVDRVPEAIDRGEVLRYLGYPPGVVPNDRISRLLDQWMGDVAGLAEPRAIFRILPVAAKDRRTLRVETAEGVTEFRGAIGEFLDVAQRVALFVATAGPGVEKKASQLLKSGDALGAMVLNAIGAERAEAAEMVVMGRLREQGRAWGLAPTLPYSPGYCGMKLEEQKKLFSLLDTPRIGVRLTEVCLMQPIKSISGLVGLGPAENVVVEGSPCDRCERSSDCNMRR